MEFGKQAYIQGMLESRRVISRDTDQWGLINSDLFDLNKNTKSV